MPYRELPGGIFNQIEQTLKTLAFRYLFPFSILCFTVFAAYESTDGSLSAIAISNIVSVADPQMIFLKDSDRSHYQSNGLSPNSARYIFSGYIHLVSAPECVLQRYV